MTTSGVTAFSNTARDVVTAAMRDASIIDMAASPESAEMTDGIFAINSILKAWQAKDVSLWRETSGDLTVMGGEASGVLPVGVRDVVDARYSQSVTNERQLTRIERAEYMRLPNKGTAGAPTMFYVSRQRDAVVLYIWPVPAADATLKIDYDRVVETVTAETQTIDLPEEYIPTLVAVLAVRLAGKYGAPINPELANRAMTLEASMMDADRPESYFMGAC